MTTDLRPTSFTGVKLRAASEDDNGLLFQIFVASRFDLVPALSCMEEEQQEMLMRMQFDAQQDQYRKNYMDARFDVIVMDGIVIGNLYTASIDNEIRLVDLAILPEHRNRGIGQALIKDLQDEGERLHKIVTLHVQQGNPAARLYSRLGFIESGEQGAYKSMHWKPS